MLPRRRNSVIVLTLTLAGITATIACSDSDSAVPTASCNACAGASYSENDCKTWGSIAGCKTSSFVATVAGCTNGCSFTDCQTPPSCEETTTKPKDAGSGFDAASDPKCAAAEKNPNGRGLFSEKPSCAEPHEANINGAIVYTCPCSGACPCGYQCGSIKLTVGGFVSSVCAPP